jgi:hypothetical protein
MKDATQVEKQGLMMESKSYHNYDLLNIGVYKRRFQYISVKPPAGKTRHQVIIGEDRNANNSAQCDLIRLALYYPYMSAADQASFNFSVDREMKDIEADVEKVEDAEKDKME